MKPALRVIATAALGVAALSSASWAQKPALTESIDEPGRNPYSETLNVSANSTAQFSAVPAGKRLVIKYINCLGVAFTYRGFAVLALTAKSINPFVTNTFLIPGAVSQNFAYYAVSSDLLAYAESGAGPTIFLSPASDVSGSCTLSGYYVTLP